MTASNEGSDGAAGGTEAQPEWDIKLFIRAWRAGRIASIITSLALLLIAFVDIGAAIVDQVLEYIHAISPNENRLLSGVLSGLELLFLAPLPYLVVLRVGSYLFPKQRHDLGLGPHEKMLQVKGLIFGLIVAALSTNLLSHMLQGTATIPLTATRCAAILTLTIVIAAFERFARE